MAENLRMFSEMEQKNLSALQELKDRPKVQIHRFPDDVLAKLKTLTDETLAEEAAKDPKFKRIYEAYQTFRLQNEAWSDISENAYLAIEK
jgi:TRAP-type mannitol/chloroaromatic compound transport system substrate-binding protein